MRPQLLSGIYLNIKIVVMMKCTFTASISLLSLCKNRFFESNLCTICWPFIWVVLNRNALTLRIQQKYVLYSRASLLHLHDPIKTTTKHCQNQLNQSLKFKIPTYIDNQISAFARNHKLHKYRKDILEIMKSCHTHTQRNMPN